MPHFKTEPPQIGSLKLRQQMLLRPGLSPRHGMVPSISYLPHSFSENSCIYCSKTAQQCLVPQQPGKTSNRALLPVILVSFKKKKKSVLLLKLELLYLQLTYTLCSQFLLLISQDSEVILTSSITSLSSKLAIAKHSN